MNRFKSILILIIITTLIMVGVFFYGRQQGKQSVLPEERISTQLILDRVTNQYFLVTKTVFVDSEAEIETPKHNDWKDIFVGNKITIKGVVRVDVGVDMKNLSLEDIVINEGQKTVSINIPSADILNTSLYGDIDFDEDKAILDKIKSIFVNNQNEDYNQAISILLTSARDEVSANGNIYNEARADSIKLVELIVGGILKDYQVVIE